MIHSIIIFRVSNKFWDSWRDFETRHGNEDTLKEMLRIKRSVQHQYNTQVNMMSAQMLSGALAASEDQVIPVEDSMKLLDSNASEASKENVNAKSNIMFVRGNSIHRIFCNFINYVLTLTNPFLYNLGETQSKAVEEADKTGVANPDEIDLDDDESSEDEEEPVAKKSKIETQAIPSEVFGGLKPDDDD